MAHEAGRCPLYMIITAAGQVSGAMDFQITMLSGRGWETDLRLCVLGGVFRDSPAVWYLLFGFKFFAP